MIKREQKKLEKNEYKLKKIELREFLINKVFFKF